MIRKDVIIPAIAGSLLTLAYPPFKLGFLAYLGLVPLFYLVRDVSVKTAFIRGIFWALGFQSFSLYWICHDTVKGGILAIIYLSFMTSVIFIFLNRGARHFNNNIVYMFPFLWTAWEFIRGIGTFGFPWLAAAYTQTYYLPLIQFASITGVFGVSFWISIINAVIYYILSNIRTKKIIPSFSFLLLLFIIPFLYGYSELNKPRPGADSLKVSLIQGNIPAKIKLQSQSIRDNYQTYMRLSEDAARKKPDLIIWPESAAYSYLRITSSYLGLLRDLVNRHRIPLFTGSLDIEYDTNLGRPRYYNSAFFIKPFSDELPSYSKTHLVPFGEWVPFADRFPFLYKIDMAMGNFSRGNKYTVFNLPRRPKPGMEPSMGNKKGSIPFSAVICFESIFSDLVRQFCRRGALFLIVITNDAWFERTSAPYQHAQISVLRAIENRIPIVRCANTGVTMIIDKMGRVVKESEIYTESIITGDIEVRNEETFYARNGEIFSYVITAIGILFMIITIIKRQ